MDGNTQVFAPLLVNGDAALQLTASAFPNPCADQIQLRFNAEESAPYQLNLYNAQNGQWLNGVLIHAVAGENTVGLAVSDYSASAFLVTISSGEALVASARFVKK